MGSGRGAVLGSSQASSGSFGDGSGKGMSVEGGAWFGGVLKGRPVIGYLGGGFVSANGVGAPRDLMRDVESRFHYNTACPIY